MDSQKFDKTVRRTIADHLWVDVEDVPDEISFIDDFGADLVELQVIILDVETKTGIEFSDEEIESIRTVGDLMRLAREKNDEMQDL